MNLFTQTKTICILLVITAVFLAACTQAEPPSTLPPVEETPAILPTAKPIVTEGSVEITTPEPTPTTPGMVEGAVAAQPTTTPQSTRRPTPIPLEDLLDVTRWKTYTNEQLRFSIQHPPHWTTSYRDGFAYLNSAERFGAGPHPIAYGVNITEVPNAAQRPFEEVVTEDLSPELQNIFAYEEVDLNGYTTYWTQHFPSMEGAMTVFFEDDTRYLVVQFGPYRTDNAFAGQEKYWPVFEAMLQTFELELTLQVCAETEHFSIYCTEPENSTIADVATQLETHYQRITTHLRHAPDGRTIVEIYPDLQSLHTAVGQPDSPDWYVGQAEAGKIQMVTPDNPGPAHTYEAILTVAAHEFTHLVVDDISDGDIPGWLDEGVATYEAGQAPAPQFIASLIEKDGLPAIANLDFTLGSDVLYALSYTVVDFIVQTYGYDHLVQLIQANGDIEAALNVSESAFEQAWHNFVDIHLDTDTGKHG